MHDIKQQPREEGGVRGEGSGGVSGWVERLATASFFGGRENPGRERGNTRGKVLRELNIEFEKNDENVNRRMRNLIAPHPEGEGQDTHTTRSGGTHTHRKGWEGD